MSNYYGTLQFRESYPFLLIFLLLYYALLIAQDQDCFDKSII